MRFIRFLAVALACVACAPAYSGAGATIGDWSLGSTADGQLYAGTLNDSGGMLIKGCDPANAVCYWYLVTQTGCDEGVSAAALVNSNQGTASLTLQCSGRVQVQGQPMYRAQISNPDLMDSIVNGSPIVGIAVGLVDGQFKVYRFSLKGASTAISTLIRGALSVPAQDRKTKPTSTRDTTL